MTPRTGSMNLTPVVEIEEITKEDGRALLAPRVQDELHLSLDEFFARVDAGDYDETTNDRVLKLVMMVPFAR